jgi:hypothetical protein
MTFIDRDELLKHEVMIITKGNAAFHGVPSYLLSRLPRLLTPRTCSPYGETRKPTRRRSKKKC